MRNDSSRRVRYGTWFILAALAFVLSGCFQNAGEAIVPTPVDLTAIAPKTPTPFVTPISTAGFVAPPTDASQVPVNPPTDMPTELPTELPTNLPAETPGQPPADTPAVAAPTLESTPIITPIASQEVVAPTSLPPTPTALPTEGPCTHTVQPGEWMMSIARKYKVTLEALLASNPNFAGHPDTLAVGDVLNIPNCGQQAQANNPPAPTTAPEAVQPTALPTNSGEGLPTPIPPTTRVYTVASGDTLGLIARKFGTTVKAIRDANNLTTDFLSVGQQLKIPQP